MQGDAATALAEMDRVAPRAKKYGDADLLGLSGLGRGQALIALERTEEGLDLLDEVMVSATAGELSETIAGLAYCAIIATCQDIFDVRRAREWTDGTEPSGAPISPTSCPTAGTASCIARRSISCTATGPARSSRRGGARALRDRAGLGVGRAGVLPRR